MERIDEKLRLLKPFLSENQWTYLRFQYALEKLPRKRLEIETMIDTLIARLVPGITSDHILLPPPEKELL